MQDIDKSWQKPIQTPKLTDTQRAIYTDEYPPPPSPRNASWEEIHDSMQPIATTQLTKPTEGLWLILGPVFIVSILLVWLTRRRRKLLRSPANRAVRAIAQISADSKGAFRDLHAALIEYLRAKTRIPVHRQSTPEILQSLRDKGFTDLQPIESFLNESDQARFSTSPRITQNDAIALCLGVIENLEEGGSRRASI